MQKVHCKKQLLIFSYFSISTVVRLLFQAFPHGTFFTIKVINLVKFRSWAPIFRKYFVLKKWKMKNRTSTFYSFILICELNYIFLFLINLIYVQSPLLINSLLISFYFFNKMFQLKKNSLNIVFRQMEIN